MYVAYKCIYVNILEFQYYLSFMTYDYTVLECLMGNIQIKIINVVTMLYCHAGFSLLKIFQIGIWRHNRVEVVCVVP